MLTLFTRGLGGPATGLLTGGLGLGGAVPPPTPDTPLLFETELSDWLTVRMGQPVIPDRLPQSGILPMLTYTIIDGDLPPLLKGPKGFGWADIQFDAWALRSLEAQQLQRKLLDLLTGIHPTMGAALNVLAMPGRLHGGYDQPSDNTGDGTFRRSRDYRISWSDPGTIT